MTEEERREREVERLAEKVAADNDRVQQDLEYRLRAIESDHTSRKYYDERHAALEAKVIEKYAVLEAKYNSQREEMVIWKTQWKERLTVLTVVGSFLIPILTALFTRLIGKL